MSYSLRDKFNIGSMEEKFLRNCFIKFNIKANIGIERHEQINLYVITEVILIQFYNLQCNNMIQI